MTASAPLSLEQTIERKIRSFVACPKLACQKPEFDACSGNGDIEHTNLYK